MRTALGEDGMRTEISCGAVVFSRAGGEVRYVLVKETSGRFSMPKGHTEEGETEQETALREILEETGLKPRLMEGFREEEVYAPREKPGVLKRVIWFLAESEEEGLSPREADVTRAAWYGLEDAMARLTQSAGRILLRADEHLRRNMR